MNRRKISVAESGAFVEVFDVAPTGSGPLNGLTFAVKDLIDVAGQVTGGGNPRWRETHPPAVTHAVCVEQVLAAGARCVGKTLTDQLGFSLLGENHHYGTPLNPRAPERVPGGSSSGSASAVACGLADFALGSDTGGSVRVPASNCGVFGLRPSHGLIPVAGVMPFGPTFDTVGVFAREPNLLAKAASVLLSCEIPMNPQPGKIHLLREAFDICDPDVRKALDGPVKHLKKLFGEGVQETSLRVIDQEAADSALRTWHEIYCVVQWAEIWSCLGAWITDAKPDFGPIISASFDLPKNLDRRKIPGGIRKRETYYRRLQEFLGPNDLFCIPTAPTPAPLKGSITRRDGPAADYYPRALALTSIAGIGRLPQVSMPLAECNGLPIGLSLLAARGQDAFLLGMINAVDGNRK